MHFVRFHSYARSSTLFAQADFPVRPMLRRDKALHLLAECRGDEIWSVDYCRQRGVPDAWIEQAADAHESGFRHHHETIYHQNRVVNQFHGIRDEVLALKIAEVLGMDAKRIASTHLTGIAIVRAIKESLDE